MEFPRLRNRIRGRCRGRVGGKGRDQWERSDADASGEVESRDRFSSATRLQLTRMHSGGTRRIRCRKSVKDEDRPLGAFLSVR